MTKIAPEADAIECDRCGGVFPVRVYARTVPCPFCRQPQTVPEPQWLALEAYVSAAKSHIDRAHSYASAAATLPGYGGMRAHHSWSPPFRARYAVALGVGIGLLLTAFIMGLYASTSQFTWWSLVTEDREEVFHAMVPSVLGVTVVTLAIWCAYGYVGSIGRAQVPMTAATCPNCGASTSMKTGAPIAVCDHCAATLLPSPELRQSALRAAAAEEQKALDAINRGRALAGENDPYKKLTVADIERLLND